MLTRLSYKIASGEPPIAPRPLTKREEMGQLLAYFGISVKDAMKTVERVKGLDDRKEDEIHGIV